MTLDSVVSPQVLNKYLILVDVKSGRFKYQSGRAGGEAKKRKSPAKSGRIGIYCAITRSYNGNFSAAECSVIFRSGFGLFLSERTTCPVVN